MIPKINSAHGSDTRNLINRAIEVLNRLGIDVQTLVAEGQLTEEQYAQLITTINGLISKGNVSVNDIDINRGKLLPRHMSEEVLKMMTGDAPVNAVPADGSITLKKLAFYKESTNKYNEATSLSDTYILSANGNELTSSGFTASGFISVKPNSEYIIRVVRHIAYYDSEKNYISGDPDVNVRFRNVVTTPQNARFMRISWGNSDSTANQQVNEGTETLTYEPYYIIIDNKYTEKHDVTTDDIVDNSINYKKTDFLKLGKNLFDPDNATLGQYVVSSSGILMNNSAYLTSDNIEVEPIKNYVANQFIRFLAFYNSEDDYVSGLENVQAGSEITIPSNANIIRISFLRENINGFQFEKGSNITPFEPYGYVIPKLLKSDDKSSASEYETDVFGKWNMKNFISQASKYTDPTFSERLEVAIIGDSWVRSKHRITQPLRNILKDKYGNGGIGSVGFAEIRLAPAETQIVTTGTWTAVNRVKGLDMRQYQSSSVGSTLKLTTFESSTELEIHHIKQVGSYRYRINGGAWKTVDTSASTFISENSIAESNVILDIEVLSGTVTLLNAYLFNSHRGAVVHQWGYGGATAGDFAGIDRSHFISELKKTNVKSVGILLGTNDMAQNVGIDSFKENVSEIVSRIKATDSLIDVFLISPSGNNLSRSLDISHYDTALQEVAVKENISYVSLYKNMGTYEEQNARGLFEDDVHPNTDGGYIIGNIVYDRLMKI